MTTEGDITALLARTHARIGGLGLDITTRGTGEVRIRWFRDYGDVGLSDERSVDANTMPEALAKVIAWEDQADITDAAEADSCPYTHAHTRHWCGHPGCRES